MIDHEVVLEMDNGTVVSSLYIDGILIDKYPRVVPDDFYELIILKVSYAEIVRDIKNIQKKYC